MEENLCLGHREAQGHHENTRLKKLVGELTLELNTSEEVWA